MYHDDYPSPPSSAGSSSSYSPSKPSLLRNSIPHLHTHSSPLSSTHSHAHAYGQRASKASDIAHLLDPSYSPSRAAQHEHQIYVDHAGEAHDPDFRLFALAKRRPTPELPCDSDDEDNVEDEGVSLYSYRRRDREDDGVSLYRTHTPVDAYAARPSSRASSHAHYTYASPPTRPRLATHDSGYPTFSYSAYEEDAGYASEDEPRRETNKLRRRRTSEEQERPVEALSLVDDERVEWT